MAKKKLLDQWTSVLRFVGLAITTSLLLFGVVSLFGKPIANEFVRDICKTEDEIRLDKLDEISKTNKDMYQDIKKLVFFYTETTPRHKIEEAKDKWEQKKLFSE